jgi:hypothetical protein
MNDERRKALAQLQKATIDTGVGAGGLLSPSQSAAFIQTVKDRSSFGDAIRLERRRTDTGEINKLTSGARLLRGKQENADDGYRAEVQFPTVDYEAKKMWLPWEVTEDEYHQNIEGEALEAKITDEMTQQLALDWDDLDVNGDEAAVGPDADFLAINDGVLAQLEANASGNVHRIDASTINGGVVTKDHFFRMIQAMPNKYRQRGQLRFLLSPARAISWVEYLTDRNTAAGDAALLGQGGASRSPLNVEFFEVPSWPDDRIVLTSPQNFVRVVTWDVRRRRVTGDTDWELATRDKRGYLFYLKADVIVLEDDAVVDMYDFDPIGSENASS